MPATRHQNRSDLFLLRLWREADAESASLWCGRLQRTVSGEEHQFHGLDGLADLLAELLDSAAPASGPTPPLEQAGPQG